MNKWKYVIGQYVHTYIYLPKGIRNTSANSADQALFLRIGRDVSNVPKVLACLLANLRGLPFFRCFFPLYSDVFTCIYMFDDIIRCLT